MNLKNNVKKIEESKFECIAGDLLNNIDWINLRTKIFEIDEIIWSLRHGNFDNYKEAMVELDELFTYQDYDCIHTNQDEFYD